MGKNLKGTLTVTTDGQSFNDDNVNAYFTNGNQNNSYFLHNTLQSGRNYDADDGTLWINFVGYESGTTRYRDFVIGDGKQTAIVTVDGSAPLMTVDANLEVRGAGADTKITIEDYGGHENEIPAFEFKRSQGGSIDTMTETLNGDVLGSIRFFGVDTGSSFDEGAAIQVTQSGSAGTQIPTDLEMITYNSTGQNSVGIKLDSSNNVTITGDLIISSLTEGSVLYAGSSGTISENNANFYWDDALGLGTTTLPEILNLDDSNPSIQFTDTGAGGDEFLIGKTATGFRLRNVTDVRTDIQVDGDGNVGFNDSTPSYKVDVNGTFRAVDDSVFDGDLEVDSRDVHRYAMLQG